MFPHLHRALLGAAETAHSEVTVLKYQVNSCSVLEVQVTQDITVMVKHAGPERRTYACGAVVTLSRTGRPSSECQICSHFTPANGIHQKKVRTVDEYSLWRNSL